MAALAEKECIPCKGEVPPLKGNDLARLASELNGGWQVVKEHHLEKEYQFKDFRQALDFTNKVGELAESQGHHPDIFLAWAGRAVEDGANRLRRFAGQRLGGSEAGCGKRDVIDRFGGDVAHSAEQPTGEFA